MTSKYKIYIPSEMKSRLLNDAELFDFVKNDGSVNLNAFLKELLINYFELYLEQKEQLLNTIFSDLSSFHSVSNKDATAIAKKIIINMNLIIGTNLHSDFSIHNNRNFYKEKISAMAHMRNLFFHMSFRDRI